MTRFILTLFIVLFGLSAQAHTRYHQHHYRHHHRTSVYVHGDAVHSGFANLSPGGRVISWAVNQFQGFINDVKAEGFSIGSPGCLSSGHMRNSKHHWGGACDFFNQYARNKTKLPLPPNHLQLAAKHGLIDGCIWHSPDCGHFEVPYRGQTYMSYMKHYRRG